jgi:hypothetical protein
MPELPAGKDLLDRGLSALKNQLGPVQTSEFMAMVSRQPFDYQQWRNNQFAGLSVDDILAQAKSQEN